MEVISFDHYRQRTAKILIGNAVTSFWDKLMLQACHESSAIRSGVYALSILTRKDLTFDLSMTALNHYNKAVKQIQVEIQPIETTLISCVLFIALEVLVGNEDHALVLLANGLNLLNSRANTIEATATSSAKPRIKLDDDIVTAFSRMDLHASGCLSQRCPRLHAAYYDHLFAQGVMSLRKSQYNFSSMTDAQAGLNEEVLIIYHFMRSRADEYRYRTFQEPPLSIYQEQQNLLRDLEIWQRAFNGFIDSSCTRLSVKDLRTALFLRLHHCLTRIILLCALQDETAYDAFTTDFEHLVSWSKSLQLEETTLTVDDPNQSFSIETGIIQPLYWTAVKCRDPKIRRAALAILLGSKWREGGWTSDLVGAMGRGVMELEEAGRGPISCCNDIPEVQRIHAAGLVQVLDRDQGDGTKLRIYKANGTGTSWMSYDQFSTWRSGYPVLRPFYWHEVSQGECRVDWIQTLNE
ncbi:hypothetical protein MMC09_003320 [Bachmanniomyces sp. S44760]|nr:hypothetical protein [Bachmanniomyces sp. S44760]